MTYYHCLFHGEADRDALQCYHVLDQSQDDAIATLTSVYGDALEAIYLGEGPSAKKLGSAIWFASVPQGPFPATHVTESVLSSARVMLFDSFLHAEFQYNQLTAYEQQLISSEKFDELTAWLLGPEGICQECMGVISRKDQVDYISECNYMRIPEQTPMPRICHDCTTLGEIPVLE